MKRFIMVAAAALALTACDATPEQQQADMLLAQQNLPERCKLSYVGPIRTAGEEYPSQVFYTICDDVVTTSETHTVQSGKSTSSRSSVTVSQ